MKKLLVSFFGWAFFKQVQTDFLGMMILLSFCLAIGLLINATRDQQLSLVYHSKIDRLNAEVQGIITFDKKNSSSMPKPLGETVSLEDLRLFVEQGGGLVLDARAEIFYRFGHIPGALSLPRDDFEKGYLKIKRKLEGYKERQIVIYCSGSACEDSRLLQNALAKLGYQKTFIFAGGWQEWTSAKYPEEYSQ